MSLSKILCIRECSNCGKEIEIRHKKRVESENVFCSQKCSNDFRKKNREKNENYFNCICPICNKKFHVKPYVLAKYKNHYCSLECHKLAKKEYMKGKKNHQYGLKGSKNSSWKSDKKVTNYGYIKVRCLEHPFKDCDGFVFEHRLIAEKYLLNNENSIEINGKKYLKPNYTVHHKDENKINNKPENLEIMTKERHSKIHALKRNKKKCKKVDKFDFNENYIETYSSIKEAASINKIHAQNISAVCKKKKGTAGGFIWKYTQNEK